MSTFVVREKQNGVLIGLPAVLQQLAFLPVALWAFRWITIFSYPRPFGVDLLEFESLTQELEMGFVVGDRDLQKFLNADFQIIEGYIDAYADLSLKTPCYTLECFDSTFWEITTTNDSLIRELESSGFEREFGDPSVRQDETLDSE